MPAIIEKEFKTFTSSKSIIKNHLLCQVCSLKKWIYVSQSWLQWCVFFCQALNVSPDGNRWIFAICLSKLRQAKHLSNPVFSFVCSRTQWDCMILQDFFSSFFIYMLILQTTNLSDISSGGNYNVCYLYSLWETCWATHNWLSFICILTFL